MNYDAKFKSYLAPIPYLISHFIYEYDISKANISVLLYKGIIDEKEFNFIKSLPREERQIYVGYMQKDKNIANILSDGVAEFRYKFITQNNVTDRELLSVKNDAIFLIDKIPVVTIFDNIEFVKKNVYNSYFNLNKLEVYYYLDQVRGMEIIDIKGVNDNKLFLHQDYFIQFLCSVFESIQTRTVKSTIELINSFHMQYINRQLPIEYYRELNADCCYRISKNNGESYLFQTISQDNYKYLDISFNLNIIRELYSIVSNVYFMTDK
jgi:hypothetical protein